MRHDPPPRDTRPDPPNPPSESSSLVASMGLQRLKGHLARAAVELEQLSLPGVLLGRTHEVNAMLIQVFALEAAVRGLGVEP